MFCRARAVKGNRSQVTESLCTVKGTLLQIQIFSQSELQYCSVSLVNINRQSVFIAYDNWSLWSETKHQNKPTHIVFYRSLYLKIVVMSAEQSLEGFKAQCLIFMSAVSR